MSTNHSSAFADLISIVINSGRNTIFNYFLLLKITCVPISIDKAININCRCRPLEYLLFHSLLFKFMLVKMIDLCTNKCLQNRFFSSLVTSNS